MRPVLLMLLVAACGSSSPPPPATPEAEPAAEPTPPSTDAEVPPSNAASLAPRPFTAEQIRDAMPVGTEIRYRIVAAGQPTVIQHWKVTAADAETGTIAAKLLAEDGTVVKDFGEGTSSWKELMEHASFPAAVTKRTETTVKVPAGEFEVVLYEVQTDSDGMPSVQRFYFAPALPGPPVKMLVTRGGEVVQAMELLEHSSPAR